MKIFSFRSRSGIRILSLAACVVASAATLGAATPLQMAQQAYAKAFNPGDNDQFGLSVAISGDTVIVGAPNESSNGTGVNDYGNAANNLAEHSGAAYVFVRNGTNWSQQAYLKASNSHSGAGFGSSVGISGDTIVVGARFERSIAPGSGAAYVFVRTPGSSIWTQQALLKASHPEAYDFFGASVAVSGNTIVVGAPLESSNTTGLNGVETNNSATYSGATYIFTRSGATWTQQAYVKASNAEAGDFFGTSVSISSNTVVVGASAESGSGVNGNQSDNNALSAGAAYVFAYDGTVWLQRAYLKASNAGPSDNFGAAVSISMNTIVVGAPWEASSFPGVENTAARSGAQDDNSAMGSGAAYVFVRNGAGTVWTQQAYLKASNPDISDQFGQAVAVSGDVVVIGAHFESSSATGINHPTGQGNNSAFSSGAAYVFVRPGGLWSQQAYVKASNTGTGLYPSDVGDNFGYAVGISGETMVTGALREDGGANGVNGNQSLNNAQQSGAAYIFTGFAPQDGPEIAVEQPAGFNLIDGKAIVELGVVSIGSSRDLAFRVHNRGNELLTGLVITLDGDHASDFSIISSPTPSITSGSNTSFTVRFAPGAAGFRSAQLHLASNDGDESPFDITLTSVPSTRLYMIYAIAGTGVPGFSGDFGLATDALLNYPHGVAVDGAGNVYIVERDNERVRRVDTGGIITTLAGTGVNGFSGDGGPAAQAQLREPRGAAVDSAGNVYIADRGNRRVRRVDTDGIISTFAGTGLIGFSGDGGPAAQAPVGSPTGLFVDSTGNVYISDTYNHVVRRVDTSGNITRVAGTGVAGFSGDGGLATQAQLNRPSAVVGDGSGNLWIADEDNFRVRRVGTNGMITTFAGNGGDRFSGDGGPAIEAQLNPSGIAVDSAGHVFIAANKRIRRVDTNGVIATVAGDGRAFGHNPGTALFSPVGSIEGLAMDGAGNIFFASHNDYRARRISPTGQTFPLRPVYASTPAPGLLRFPDFEVGATDPVQLTLFIGNVGTTALRIDSIGFTDTNFSEISIQMNASGFPHVIPSGAPDFGGSNGPIELILRWMPGKSGFLETTLRIVSNDPATPVAVYTVYGGAFDPAAQATENIIANWFVSSIGGSLADGSGKLQRAAHKNISLTGQQTATLTIAPNPSNILIAEIPAFLGGGSVQLSNFTGSVTVSLLPIPNDFERVFIRVEGGSLTAPSVRLPSGLDTGLNQLTFGPPEQSGGVLFLTNGSYTAYAIARIVNNLIPEGVTVRGNYSGIYNAETGEVSSQSDSTDLFERSDRVLFSSASNGFWLTWANTNALEQASNIIGPWQTVTNGASPFAVVTTNHPQQFFRLRLPPP